ncbi:hypothetical protein P7C73_g6816, partial [Tremellales sp. Uapishka_1]
MPAFQAPDFSTWRARMDSALATKGLSTYVLDSPTLDVAPRWLAEWQYTRTLILDSLPGSLAYEVAVHHHPATFPYRLGELMDFVVDNGPAYTQIHALPPADPIFKSISFKLGDPHSIVSR